MADIIQLLPDALANQIAAGEVVQRPASVVKELLENAIDAGATQIKLIVKEAGKTLIQVIDNGKGMSENDARMCFERHATSKISKTDDLFCIKTMGFRGEAMASIAAVAQVELKSKSRDAELGTLLKIEGSDVILQEPVTHSIGTSISVKNLFFNVPARRNFLKSNAIEFSHILDEFIRVSLAFPEVSFSLFHNEHEIYNIQSSKLSQRIVALFGKNYKEQLITIEEETPYVKIYGYVGKPENAKKRRGEQFFFVNDRFIKHPYLHHAIMESFRGLMPEDYYPFYVIKMELNPASIDINVHPTKTEIKFEDERTVYGVLKTATQKGLGLHNVVPSINFDVDMNFGTSFSRTNLEEAAKESVHKGFSTFKSTAGSRSENQNVRNWNMLFETPTQSVERFENPIFQEKSELLTFESSINVTEEKAEIQKPESNNQLMQLHKQYIIAPVKSGMMILDQNAAHERILFEKFLNRRINPSAASQQSLFPSTFEISPSDYALVLEIQEDILALGFSFSLLSNHTVMVSGKPADLNLNNEREAFEGLIEQYKQYRNELKLDVQESLARALAKKSAIKSGVFLSTDEMQAIIDQLFACQNPAFGLNNNATFSILGFDKISQLLNKPL